MAGTTHKRPRATSNEAMGFGAEGSDSRGHPPPGSPPLQSSSLLGLANGLMQPFRRHR
jgi:hypothetical protein